jgi:hypothetical protein
MGYARTVEFGDVLVLCKTKWALFCRIAGKSHSLALSRRQPGSTVQHAGDRGVLVLMRDFALARGLIVNEPGPRARCGDRRRDGLPCASFPRTGSRFCVAHGPRTAGEPSAPQIPPPANAPRPSRCESPRSNGVPCRARRRPGVVFCYSHDPATVEQRKAAQALAIAAVREASVRRREKRTRAKRNG